MLSRGQHREQSTLNWTHTPAPALGLFAARAKFKGVALADGAILFMGGTDCLNPHTPSPPCQLFNDVYELRAGNNVLNEITAAAEWEPRYGFCLAARAGSDDVFLIGGSTQYGTLHPASDRLYNDAWKTVDRGATWAKISTNVFDAFGTNGMVWHNCASTSPTTLVVVGGAAGYHYSTVRKSTDSGKTWATVSASPSCATAPTPWIGALGNGRIEFGFAYMPVRKRLVLTGGFSQVGRHGVNVNGQHNDVWVSDDGGACWTALVPDTDAQNDGTVGVQLAVFEDNGVEVIHRSGGLTARYALLGGSRSLDGGATWLSVGTQQQESAWSPRFHHAVVYDPVTPRLVLCGGEGDELTNATSGGVQRVWLRDVWTASTSDAALVNTPAPTPLPTLDPTQSPTFPPNTPNPTVAGDICACDTMSNASTCAYRFDTPYPHHGVCSRGSSNVATPVPCHCIVCPGTPGSPDNVRCLGNGWQQFARSLCFGVQPCSSTVAVATFVILLVASAACVCFECVYLPLMALRRTFVRRIKFCSANGLGHVCLCQCFVCCRGTAVVARAPDGRRFYCWEWRSERAARDMNNVRMQYFLNEDDVSFRQTLLKVFETDGMAIPPPPSMEDPTRPSRTLPAMSSQFAAITS